MLETQARREGDEYVLDGEKRWIGNTSFADVVIVWARDDEYWDVHERDTIEGAIRQG
jgi:alkylation response protein AidB-like acyl-CoA dehydrogenase